jgi:hypothetical protein
MKNYIDIFLLGMKFLIYILSISAICIARPIPNDITDYENGLHLLDIISRESPHDLNALIEFSKHDVLNGLDNLALRISSLSGKHNLVHYLLANPFNDPSDHANEAIRSAAQYSDVEMVRLLLSDIRVNPGARGLLYLTSKDGMCILDRETENYPIIISVINNQEDIWKELLNDFRTDKHNVLVSVYDLGTDLESNTTILDILTAQYPTLLPRLKSFYKTLFEFIEYCRVLNVDPNHQDYFTIL